MNESKPQSPDSAEHRCGGCCASVAQEGHMDWSADAEARPVALVTGGAVRIGEAICRTLCLAGYDILIHCRRSTEEAERLQAEFIELGAGCQVLTADLSDVSAAGTLIEGAWEFAGRLDLLVNNASVFSRQPLTEADAAVFEEQWRINALMPMLLTREYARRMADAQRDGGCVVNLLDRRVATHEPGCLAYLTSKKALAEFTCSAALELAPAVRVNGVAPGAVLPPPDGVMSETAGRAPLNTPPLTEDVARAVLYLAEADCVTGQVLYVDGGQHLVSTETRKV